METLVLDGKEFVKASKAAKDLGYTSDYIGQLCRSGKIQAQLVGRAWYVRVDDLSVHKVEKKRISRVKAREQAKRTIAEHRKNSAEKSKKTTQNIGIRYEPDDGELIPQTRKITITPTEAAAHVADDAGHTKPVRLDVQTRSRSVPVVATPFTERLVDQGVVEVLAPKERTRTATKPQKSVPTQDVSESVVLENATKDTSQVVSSKRKPHVMPYVFLVLVVVLVNVISVMTVSLFVYSDTNTSQVGREMLILPKETFDNIRSKI